MALAWFAGGESTEFLALKAKRHENHESQGRAFGAKVHHGWGSGESMGIFGRANPCRGKGKLAWPFFGLCFCAFVSSQ